MIIGIMVLTTDHTRHVLYGRFYLPQESVSPVFAVDSHLSLPCVLVKNSTTGSKSQLEK